MTREPSLRIVLADDEPLAREGLASDLAALSASGVAVEVVAACASGAEAVEAVRRLKPDLLLLDVEMPELDGFAMLERLEPEETPAAVIFVTAFDAYAVRAFEARALDYLVKPAPRDRLASALARAAQRVREARALREEIESRPAPPAGDGPLSSIVVRDRDRTSVVKVDDLRWIEAASYYVRLHVPGGAWLLRERMSRLEARLDPARFFRTHRSAIVRLALVREVHALSRYEHEVMLEGGARVPLARERRAGLEGALERLAR